ncbi:MAG: hydrogenase maturation protease [Anaerolineales bacterium]|nr:hydrogenase maturation protease [Anaerolineales bacterium]
MEPKKVLVLGLGNPLRGDDGVGCAVVEALANSPDLPEGLELIDGGASGVKMLSMIDGYEHVIIVDAADLESPPGKWTQCTAEELFECADRRRQSSTLHEAGLVEALEIGRQLARLPEDIRIYLIQAERIDGHLGLSHSVCKSIEAICTSILAEVTSIRKH